MKKSITETEEELNSVTLKKQANGGYTWDIKVYGSKVYEIVDEIYETDKMLREKYTS